MGSEPFGKRLPMPDIERQAQLILGALKAGRHVQTKDLRELISGLLIALDERTSEHKWAMQQVI